MLHGGAGPAALAPPADAEARAAAVDDAVGERDRRGGEIGSDRPEQAARRGELEPPGGLVDAERSPVGGVDRDVAEVDPGQVLAEAEVAVELEPLEREAAAGEVEAEVADDGRGRQPRRDDPPAPRVRRERLRGRRVEPVGRLEPDLNVGDAGAGGGGVEVGAGWHCTRSAPAAAKVHSRSPSA